MYRLVKKKKQLLFLGKLPFHFSFQAGIFNPCDNPQLPCHLQLSPNCHVSVNTVHPQVNKNLIKWCDFCFFIPRFLSGIQEQCGD